MPPVDERRLRAGPLDVDVATQHRELSNGYRLTKIVPFPLNVFVPSDAVIT